MSLTTTSKFDLVLKDKPWCAICNKPTERVETMYDPNSYSKRFRVYCHGDAEEALLSDEAIENTDSIRFGEAFIDKLPQPQLRHHRD
jgi:hypothetical protein